MDFFTSSLHWKERAQIIIKIVTYLLIAFYFFLNFQGSPALKWVYPLFIIIAIISISLFDLKGSVIPILALCFVEGQGRVLWSYHPVMRIIFDFTILLAFLKSLIKHQFVFPIKQIPKPFLFALLFHFLWFFVQIFNIKNVGYVGVIAASKIYIFPFLVLFLFLMNPFQEDKKLMTELILFVCIMFILEGTLSNHQMKLGEDFLYGITGYYRKATKNIFTGIAFRPFGTGHLPGAISTYFMLTIGFMFLIPTKNFWIKALKALAIVVSLFSLFIMQVRASLIKELLILMILTLVLLLNSANRSAHFLKSVILTSIAILLIGFAPPMEKLFPDLNLKMSTERLMKLKNTKKISEHRASPSLFLSVMKEKLTDNPLGLGPGRTGAASGIASNAIKNDPVYGVEYSWTHDNLYISLAIDLGFGMIFYLMLIFGFPLALIYYSFFVPVTSQSYRIIAISAITPLVLVIGNWGALGIPYNPESFFFWFWVAIGLNEVNKSIRYKESKNL